MKRFVLLALAAASAPASAHIVMAPPEATAGSYYAGAIRIGHGCDAAATTAVRVDIPGGILTARPRPKPGWEIEVDREALAVPVTIEGKQVRERVSGITWRGTLPADQFDEFGLMLKLPAGNAGPLYLPVTQSCGATEVRWGDVPAPGAAWTSVPNPAPVLDVKASAGGHAH